MSSTVSGQALKNLFSFDRAVRAALAGRAVVGAVEDQRVVELARLLEVIDDPARPGRRCTRRSRRTPRPSARTSCFSSPESVSHGRIESPSTERARRHRIDRRQLGALGQDSALDHPRQHPFAVRVVAVVERALVLVDVLLRRVVRSVVGARAEPQVPRLVRLRLLRVADELERLVGEVLRQVVAVLGPVGLLDVVVVLGEVGKPLVRLAAEEPVEAVVAEPERPVLLRRAHRERVDRGVVVLADPERAQARVAQDGRDRARTRGGMWEL